MNYLTYLPAFDKLTKSQQDTLTNSAYVRKFNKNELLHNGSQDCMGLILVLSGQLRAFTISDDGREITMYRLFERDICLFSASCIMNSIQFDIAITAEKDTEVLVIPSEIYKNIMEVSAPLANYTNEVMADRFSDVMWLINQVMWKSFDKRLADFLLSESNIEGSSILKITHETIGSHLGSPREVVTRMLKYFVNEGLISLSRGTIEIIDKKGLEKIIDR
ncbi:MAG: Crp/Fnr family transcriptional regulator [Lachnospiraceae bacterium]|nr:Crp/Fnr family transcriptional regulator [Lachnospiraceae bacterium]